MYSNFYSNAFMAHLPVLVDITSQAHYSHTIASFSAILIWLSVELLIDSPSSIDHDKSRTIQMSLKRFSINVQSESDHLK